MITMDNAEEYVELMFDFCMHTGIQKQMEAFRGKTTLADLLCEFNHFYYSLLFVPFILF